MLTIAFLLGLKTRPEAEPALVRERDAKRARLRRLLSEIREKDRR